MDILTQRAWVFIGLSLLVLILVLAGQVLQLPPLLLR